MDARRRHQLLQFWTGCPAPPALGMAKFVSFRGTEQGPELTVVPHISEVPAADGGSSWPRAATCFFALRLPAYPTEAALREVLLDSWDVIWSHRNIED